jgi:hypothetical protein
MAITQDGSQAFGISTASFDGFVVESFTKTGNTNRVDLDDGNGEPLGSVVVPKRDEVSLTVQVGSGNTTPTKGANIVYGADTIVITEVGESETQEDYQRLNLSGYVKIN